MSTPFIGEIQAFPYNFAPRNWATCDGSLLAINQNQALFSIVGTTYGGNGISTFALPDLRGRAAVHVGDQVTLGQSAGEEMHTLSISETPAHNHQAMATEGDSNSNKPSSDNTWGVASIPIYTATPNTTMSPNALSTSGKNNPHSNIQPYTVLTYCIALYGIFPSRN
jgi:microcystin-dependent protein